MSTEIIDLNDNAAGVGGSEPYGASWVDRLSGWVNRLPGQSWPYYLGLAVLLLVLQAATLRVEGGRSAGSVPRIHLFIAIVIPFFLALFEYLDARASKALETLRPSLTASDETLNELRYRLTTLPGRPTLLASVVILLLVFVSESIDGAYQPEVFAGLPFSMGLFRFLYLVLWWLLGTFLYHTLHQLRLIDHVYTNYAQINLFRAKPFYAFSTLSAFTAGSISTIIYFWLLVNPVLQLNDPFVLVWMFAILASAMATFLWPQLGMHRLQVEEQNRLLDEAYSRLEETILKMHQQLDDGQYEEVAKYGSAMATLEAEIAAIRSIRTWPWEPGTLRALVTAVALPLTLWVIQLILGRALGS